MHQFRNMAAASALVMAGFAIQRGVYNSFAYHDLGLTAGAVGWVEAWRELPGLLAAVLALVAVFFSRARLQVLTIALIGLGGLLVGWAGGFWSLVAFTVIQSVGFHLWIPVQEAMMIEFTRPEERGLWLGRLTSANAATGLAGMALVYLLARTVSYRGFFWIGGVLVLAGAAFAALVRDSGRAAQPGRRTVRRGRGGGTADRAGRGRRGGAGGGGRGAGSRVGSGRRAAGDRRRLTYGSIVAVEEAGPVAVDWQGFWAHVLDQCRAARDWFDKELHNLRHIPPPETVTDRRFMQLLAGTVLGTGLSSQVMGRLWPRLEAAFRDWNPQAIAGDPVAVRTAALAALRNPPKVDAVIDAALRVAAEPGIGARLARMTLREALAFLQSFKFVGKITSYWLARDLGLDVQHPDRLTEGIAACFGLDANALCAELAAECNEKEGTVDLVIWWWATWYGHEAFEWARLFAGGAVGGSGAGGGAGKGVEAG